MLIRVTGSKVQKRPTMNTQRLCLNCEKADNDQITVNLNRPGLRWNIWLTCLMMLHVQDSSVISYIRSLYGLFLWTLHYACFYHRKSRITPVCRRKYLKVDDVISLHSFQYNVASGTTADKRNIPETFPHWTLIRIWKQEHSLYFAHNPRLEKFPTVIINQNVIDRKY